MKKIVFLGNSLAAVKAIEEIRRGDQESRLTIVSKNQDWPCRRNLFVPYLAKELKEFDVLAQPADFYKKNNVQLLFDKKIARIDFKKNRLMTEEKENIEFDVLVITDVQIARFPDIKGIQKTNVFGFRSWGDIKAIGDLLPIIETVAVEGSDLSSLLLVCAFKKRQREVIWVVPDHQICPQTLSSEQAQAIGKLLEGKGVHLIPGTSIKEILGDVEAKAVRLPSGKVLAAQAVIFTQPKSDFRLLQNGPLTLGRAIAVNDQLKTNLENIFAVDDVCELFSSPECDAYEFQTTHVPEQGRVVGLNILGQTTSYIAPARHLTIPIFDVTLILNADYCQIVENQPATQGH